MVREGLDASFMNAAPPCPALPCPAPKEVGWCKENRKGTDSLSALSPQPADGVKGRTFRFNFGFFFFWGGGGWGCEFLGPFLYFCLPQSEWMSKRVKKVFFSFEDEAHKQFYSVG